MPENGILTREESRDICERALSFSTADQALANLESSAQGNTRFAVNQMSTSGDVLDAGLTVTSAFGQRTASASTNRFDDESLRRVVGASERLARLVPEDREYMGELGPQEYVEVDAFHEATATLDPDTRARVIAAVSDPAATRNLTSTGYLVHAARSEAVATTKGLFAYSRDTRVTFTTTVRTPDGTGSGWAGTSVHDWNDLDTAALGARAIEKAERSRNPSAVEPGRWTVVLEPTAVGNLVGLMVGAMNARAADEGRSFFSRAGGGNRIGERFLDERVTIHSDPADPRLYSAPFDGSGLPNRRMVWVENGVLRNLTYDRYWAAQKGVEPTGFANGYYMTGGAATLDEMIRSTERGLLVTRFWYIRPVDPRTILYTGLTRDGTFLIENGQISHPVKNFRWNESPVFMLNNLEMMGEPVRVSSSESGDIAPAVWVPPVKARDFTFTSLSDAV